MSNAPLLERQISLLRYLTSGEAIFGEGTSADPMLRGLDPALLRLEARFSFAKRMAKVRGIFANTFRYLGDRLPGLERDFALAYPPDDIGRYRNARQFLSILEHRWRSDPPVPPFVLDVARLELALAKARSYAAAAPIAAPDGPRPAVRRHASAELLHCRYDVRGVFDKSVEMSVTEPRETLLVVNWSAAKNEAQVLEIAPALFRLLEAFDDWTATATCP